MKDTSDIGLMQNVFSTVKIMSKDLQLALLKGELDWEDEKIQLFIPIALKFTDFEWLKLIAEHNCIKEDELIIKNFLDMVESLKDFNLETLHREATQNMEMNNDE